MKDVWEGWDMVQQFRFPHKSERDAGMRQKAKNLTGKWNMADSELRYCWARHACCSDLKGALRDALGSVPFPRSVLENYSEAHYSICLLALLHPYHAIPQSHIPVLGQFILTTTKWSWQNHLCPTGHRDHHTLAKSGSNEASTFLSISIMISDFLAFWSESLCLSLNKLSSLY